MNNLIELSYNAKSRNLKVTKIESIPWFTTEDGSLFKEPLVLGVAPFNNNLMAIYCEEKNRH